ncbi:hypothetical protein BGW36DRAFT_433114 [Talaromyces proteolyticus]|uniref:DUF4291 domain-containing protein n=1 Tax=Talaromyces proteolyticus TaxID=1131652 RepID=A0AAD4PUJ2_9EURO|nr:uncharacterized protein BGW36DRAFT_433114 [Talaromyces proteolyticus]KAH8690162.1 hypothetical protein BGW36DRAFT_433114 [Talaromyces proteolyticus]
MSTNQSPARHSFRAIRAQYTATTITVYQAYNSDIANPALEAQKFISPPFSMSRMTWIKPSFLWMAYRCGYASKPGQERVLAIEITRAGFEWALRNSCLSHYDGGQQKASDSDKDKKLDEWRAKLRASPVRIQWDPERNLKFAPLPHRSIQIGLGPQAVQKYLNEWVVSIKDVTERMRNIHELVEAGLMEDAEKLVPIEQAYPLSDELRAITEAS